MSRRGVTGIQHSEVVGWKNDRNDLNFVTLNVLTLFGLYG